MTYTTFLVTCLLRISNPQIHRVGEQCGDAEAEPSLSSDTQPHTKLDVLSGSDIQLQYSRRTSHQSHLDQPNVPYLPFALRVRLDLVCSHSVGDHTAICSDTRSPPGIRSHLISEARNCFSSKYHGGISRLCCAASCYLGCGAVADKATVTTLQHN
jgi:hypothetical protein